VYLPKVRCQLKSYYKMSDKIYEVRNNLENGIALHMPDGSEKQLAPRQEKKSVILSKEEASFCQVRQLERGNLIRIKEKKQR